MGLPKHHRLRRRDDFSRIYQKGNRYKAKYLTLRVLPRNRTLLSTQRRRLAVDASVASTSPTRNLPTRIGISISLKVDKRAVVRNRIRRQIQAIFGQLLPKVLPNWDLLVIAHPDAVQCDYWQFLQELEQLLINAEVIDGNSGGCVL